MFSYQHRYHAGSFADVHKHIALVAILNHLQKKDAPFAILDTHAGEGLYDLKSREAQRNQEYKEGIQRLLKSEKPLPTVVKQYVDIVRSYGKYYPGSPAISAKFLRGQDDLILVEGHPGAFEHLKKHLGNNPHIHMHHRDSWEALKALVPFKEKRGLIFIDPSYEVKTEYRDIVKAVKIAYERFPQGIYLIWYPILAVGLHHKMVKQLSVVCEDTWHHEWVPDPDRAQGLLGSGIFILNPPWQIDKTLNKAFS